MHYVGRVLIALRASHTSLQVALVSLQLSEFLLMASRHLPNMCLELVESVNVYHGCRGRIGVF